MSNQIISDEAVEMGFSYLNTSSQEIAAARGNQIRMEYKAKRVHARLFLQAEGNVEARKAAATDHDDYAVAMENVAVAEETWERMKDQRNRAELIIKAWQTAEASGRQIRSIR